MDENKNQANAEKKVSTKDGVKQVDAGGKRKASAKTPAKRKASSAKKSTTARKSSRTKKSASAKVVKTAKRVSTKEEKVTGQDGQARLSVAFREEIMPALMKELNYKTHMQVPRLKKIVLNMGVGEAVNDKKILEHAVKDLTLISGQKPVITKARKSVAGFKIREGYPIGCKVTLRGQRMFEFLDRLISIAIPRVRDFRGISPKSFDGRGNFNMGVKEQIIFPEIEYDKIDALRGLNITIATTAKTDTEGKSLLSAFKFPLRS